MTMPPAAIQHTPVASPTSSPTLSASGHIAGLRGIATWAPSLAGTAHGTTKRVRDVRHGRRAARGLSLFGSLLAMAVLGTLVLAVITWLEDRSLEERERIAGGQLETLAHGVGSYVHSIFTTLPATLPREITLGELRTAGVLPDGFGDVDALGRGFRVLARDGGSGAVDVVVAETLPTGDTLVPSGALLGDRFGGVRMGVVPPDTPTRLRGPTVDVDVSAFQGGFGGVPAVGALAAFERFDHGSVFGDQLYRLEIKGFAEANRMETALDLGGNDIENGGLVKATSLDVTEDFETGGELKVSGKLIVGQAVEVTGAVTVTGAVSAGGGTFTGTVSADSMAANDSIQTATVTATGTVTAATVSASGAVSADRATIGDLQSGTVNAAGVTMTSGTAERISAGSLGASGNIQAATAGISRLTVGSCSGC